MVIQPRLKVVLMDKVMCDAIGTKSVIRIHVELCEPLGLCIHLDEYEGWKVSHYLTGRVILKRLDSRVQAIEYMMKLRVVRLDWKQTYEQFIKISETTPIIEQVLSLQDEIDGKEVLNGKNDIDTI